jgi:hypothetical protein
VYVTYTCAHAHASATPTHTERQNHTQMPHRRSASQTRTLSLRCCQIKAWKAGRKGECVAAARADTRTAAKPTADQMRVVKMLEQLAGAADWRGVAAQERAARAVAAAVRTSMPGYASFVYGTLGNAYQNLGSFSKALEHHKEHLTMAKEAQSTRRWHISKSTSRGACNGDVTLAAGEDRRGARTRRCSRAAAAV